MPYVGGDEPWPATGPRASISVCPTYVGMN